MPHKLVQESDEATFEMTLSGLRKALGKTQVEVAKKARMAQTEVSAFERRTSHNTTAIRRYVKALGGTVEVVAVLGKNQRIILKDV